MPEPNQLTTPTAQTVHAVQTAVSGNGVHPPKEKAGKKGKPEKAEKAAKGRADRTAESFLRINHAKLEQLSAMADSKANMMLTIGVGVIGVSATQIFDPQLQYAALTLIVSSLVTVGLAVLATMPTLPTTKAADPKDPQFNMTFFSDVARIPYDEYLAEMERILADRTLTNRALLKDLYSHAKVLNGKKFRLLGYCYRVFFGGLVVAVLVLLVTLVALWR